MPRRTNDSADAAYYLCANRNKKSVTVDFTTAEGQAIIRDLARQADVVLENFRVGGLETYGLDYASLRTINPQLIYCSITGFGQTGPYAPRAGYDLLVQAMGGLMSITGRRDDEAGAATDILTAIGTAARSSPRTLGVGQHDLGLLDVQVAAWQSSHELPGRRAPRRSGKCASEPGSLPRLTSDGYTVTLSRSSSDCV